MNKAILLLGGNIGDTLYYLNQCKELLNTQNSSITSVSKIYETEAWGVENQQNYLNQAFSVETTYSPIELLNLCQKIEHKLGRIRKEKWGSRTIDIDIIFFNDIIIESERLTIPHPRYSIRNFVLYPLHDLIPFYICPIIGKNISEQKKDSMDQLMVKEFLPKVSSLTKNLTE